MLLRCRRLLHSAPIKFPKPHKPSKTLHPQLSPKLINSTISSCPSDSISLSFFLWCARQPNYFHARDSFDEMVPIIRRLTYQFKSVHGIIRELEEMGCPTKAQTFLILLRIYWSGDMFIFARELFDEMLRRGFTPNVFARNMIIDVLFKEGKFDEAMRFFRETQFPNFLSFNIVMGNLCRRNDRMRVREVLREMVRRGYELNIGTFMMCLGFFKKGGRIWELLQLLGFMIVSGFRLTAEIWSILIHEFCKIGEVGLACNLLRKMVDSGCSPTVVTYTTVVKGLFGAQMYNEAYGAWDFMMSKGCNPDLVLYNVLIDSLLKVGRFGDAIEVFHCLRNKEIRPDSYTLSSLFHNLLSAGKVSLLPKLISGLDFSVDLVVYNSLLNVFCKGGFPNEAVKLYNDMIVRGFSPDGYSYAALLRSLCRLGCIDYAVSFYHSIVGANSEIDAYVHAAIFVGLIKQGKYHMAIKLFREAMLKNYRLDVVSYTITIHGLFRAGRFEEACSLFKVMKPLGISPNICTYNVMLSGLCKNRDVSAVKELLRNMEMDGIKKDIISFKTLINSSIPLHHVCSVDLHSQLLQYLESANFSDSSESDTSELLVCFGS